MKVVISRLAVSASASLINVLAGLIYTYSYLRLGGAPLVSALAPILILHGLTFIVDLGFSNAASRIQFHGQENLRHVALLAQRIEKRLHKRVVAFLVVSVLARAAIEVTSSTVWYPIYLLYFGGHLACKAASGYFRAEFEGRGRILVSQLIPAGFVLFRALIPWSFSHHLTQDAGLPDGLMLYCLDAWLIIYASELFLLWGIRYLFTRHRGAQVSGLGVALKLNVHRKDALYLNSFNFASSQIDKLIGAGSFAHSGYAGFAVGLTISGLIQVAGNSVSLAFSKLFFLNTTTNLAKLRLLLSHSIVIWVVFSLLAGNIPEILRVLNYSIRGDVDLYVIYVLLLASGLTANFAIFSTIATNSQTLRRFRTLSMRIGSLNIVFSVLCILVSPRYGVLVMPLFTPVAWIFFLKEIVTIANSDVYRRWRISAFLGFPLLLLCLAWLDQYFVAIHIFGKILTVKFVLVSLGALLLYIRLAIIDIPEVIRPVN